VAAARTKVRAFRGRRGYIRTAEPRGRDRPRRRRPWRYPRPGGRQFPRPSRHRGNLHGGRM